MALKKEDETSGDEYRKAVEIIKRMLALDMDAYLRSRAQKKLGDAYLGLAGHEDMVENAGLAAEAYGQALFGLSPGDFPALYGSLKNGLGLALMSASMVSGDKNGLLEAAEAFEETLRMRMQGDSPERYAQTQENLAEALAALAALEGPARKDRCKGAIRAYEEALRASQPGQSKRAAIQSRLGTLYRMLAELEDGKGNAKRAVEACLEALEVHDLSSCPDKYAEDMLRLGNAYQTLSETGNRAENLKRARSAYEEALGVPGTPKSIEVSLWINLGTATVALAEALEDDDLLEEAFSACQRAVDLSPPGSSQWSAAMNNLGNAYLARAEAWAAQEQKTGDAASDDPKGGAPGELGTMKGPDALMKAVGAYEAALGPGPGTAPHENTPQNPQRRGDIKANLGSAYLALARQGPGDGRNRLCLAAVCTWKEALGDAQLPLERASLKVDLAQAHMLMAEEGDDEGWMRAAAALHGALEVYTPEGNPEEYASASADLALVYANLAGVAGGLEAEEYSQEAAAACKEALRVYDAAGHPEERGTLLRVLWAAYARMAKSCGDTDVWERALETVMEWLDSYGPGATPGEYAEGKRNLGYTYLALAEARGEEGLAREAARAYEKAVEALAGGPPMDRADALADLGYANAALGALGDPEGYRSAVRTYRKALKIYSADASEEGSSKAEGCITAMRTCKKALKEARRFEGKK